MATKELSEPVSPGLARKLAVIRTRGHSEHRREQASWPKAADLLPELERDGMATFVARTRDVDRAGERAWRQVVAMGEERRRARERRVA